MYRALYAKYGQSWSTRREWPPRLQRPVILSSRMAWQEGSEVPARLRTALPGLGNIYHGTERCAQCTEGIPVHKGWHDWPSSHQTHLL